MKANTKKSNEQLNHFIEYLLEDKALNHYRVMELVKYFLDSKGGNTPEEVLRVMSYLTGFSNYPNVPDTSSIKENALLESYDIFLDVVYFTYIAKREFKVSDDVEEPNFVFKDYASIPENIKWGTKTTKTITVQYYENSFCSLDKWLEGK